MYEPNVDVIRKAASLENGRRFVEEYNAIEFNPVVVARMQKAAHADPELLKIAAWASSADTLEMYELLGGDYQEKQAVSMGWVQKAVQSGAQKASPQRLSGFVARMGASTSKIDPTKSMTGRQFQGVRKRMGAETAGVTELRGLNQRLSETAGKAKPAPVVVY
jgi:hypothetical protein